MELRQYQLRPGQRDVLVELFEREFIEPQEAAGMRILGQFRDLDDPDRFVWLRGFPDMATRAKALETFYYGPVWRAHRDAANATMLDSDNVLLLRPVAEGAGFALPAARPPLGQGGFVPTVFTVTIISRGVPAEPPRGPVVARYETEPAPNNFPQLPVRTGEEVSVWFQRFADPAAVTGPAPTLRLSPTPRSLLR